MNIKEELNNRVFGWLEDWFVENGLDLGDVNNFKFIFDHSEEFDKRKNEAYKKYNIIELDEDDNECFGITKDDTVLKLSINNKDYLVACAERLYCILGEYKWRWF